MDTEIQDGRKEALMKKIADYKEMIENRTFDEYDVRKFMHFFHFKKEYEMLNGLEMIMCRRQKGKIKMLELCYRFADQDVQYVFHDNSETNEVYQKIKDELIQFGKEHNITMEEQTIKEIIVCIYSLIQFTTVHCNKTREHANSLFVKRYCLIEKNDTLSFAVLQKNHINLCSTLKNIHFLKEFNHGLITDHARCKRIDGKLKIMNFPTDEVIAEVEE